MKLVSRSGEPVPLSQAQSRDIVVRSGTSHADPTELLFYWRAIAKRKLWVLWGALICAAIALAIALSIAPVYRATVTLMIEQSKAKLVSIEEVYTGVSPNREHYQTQAELLRSPALAIRVIHKLRLVENPEFDPRQRKSGFLRSALRLEGNKEKSSWTQEEVEAAVLAEFIRRIGIEPVRLTQLVKLSFDAGSRDLAAQIANTLAEAYIESDVEVRSRLTQDAGDWLAGRLGTLKENLEQSERALQHYREKEGLLDTKGLAQSGVTKQIEELTRALNDAAQRRVDAENHQRQLKGARGVESSPVVLRAPHLDRLRELESAAEKNLAALSNRYGPEHPRIVHAERQLREARRNTREAMEAVVATSAREYEIAAADELATRRALATAKGSVRDINRKEFQLEALEQDVTTNRQLYEKFLNRYRETRAASDTRSSVVARIIDPAVAPGNAYKPRVGQIVQIGLVLGLIFGAIGAVLRERIDSTMVSAEHVQEKLGVPTVAVLPMLSRGQRDGAGRHYLEHPHSAFSEAIRTARTGILLSSLDERNKVLLVTSSVPNEGKSSCAANLALALAQTRKTLLVEADLRRPSIASHLGLTNSGSGRGLLDALSGRADLSECVQRIPGSSLHVLAAGTSAENPLELLSSGSFQDLIQRLSQSCDIVVIDSPPVHLVSDANVLARIATGVLFVVRAGVTPYPLARRALKTLADAGANVLGVALNQVDVEKAQRYDNGYTGYSRQQVYSARAA